MVHISTFALVSISSLLPLVYAHGLPVGVTGANSVNADRGFGNIASVPRNTASLLGEGDTPVMRKQNGPCGKTKKGGKVDITSELARATEAGLPSAAADGTVTMIYHQVNADGAGPYSCQVSADGTGTDFVDMDATKNLPGVAGLSLNQKVNLVMKAVIPSGVQCTGGPQNNACVVACKNVALAGPFGGCVAVTQDNSTSAAASDKNKRYVRSRIATNGAEWI